MREHGADAVAEIIEDAGWSYPVSVRKLLNEYALHNIRLDSNGNTVMVGEIVSPDDVREFTSEEDLKRKLEPLFEEHRAERTTGLLERVRRYFT